MLIDITCYLKMYTILIIFFNIKYFFYGYAILQVSLSVWRKIFNIYVWVTLVYVFALCIYTCSTLINPFLGDAAFWINMRTGGHQDPLTQHGGCPVLVGSKWITNKWVGYSDQVWQYPCSVQGPFDKFQKFTDYYWILYTF